MMNKTIVIILIVILAVISLTLTAGLIFLLNNNSGISFVFSTDKNLELVDTFDEKYDDIKNIYLDLKSSDVEIKENFNDNIKIEIYSNNENIPRIQKEDSVIKVLEDEMKKQHIGLANYKTKVVFYVPNKYVGEFNIVLTSGDIVVEKDISNNKFICNSTSGDMDFNNIGDCDISTTSGDITIKTATKDLKASTTSGDIDIEKVNKKIIANTTSGDIDIDELNIKENSEIEVKNGDIEIKNNICNCYIDANTTNGDTKINNSDRKSDIELKIKTVNGDILVN